MNAPKLLFGICAPPGLDKFFLGLSLIVVLGGLLVVGLISYFAVRDLYRWGRGEMSWLAAGATALLFSGGGYLLMGLAGATAGAPLLIAFGLGRRKRVSGAEEIKNERTRP